ncbi:MAG: hypothetical protein DI539_09505 [Flavobacterium psychrophilum]|nr:MAG: hypothetical protein DI539_09505 [Flavobacterium psychrophilum]
MKMIMKKLITLMLAVSAMMLTSCSADDSAPVQNVTPVEQIKDTDYTIIDTNVNDLVIRRYRDSVWTTDPQWVLSKKVPVRDKDVILLSSNGEVSTEEKQLFVKIECTIDNPAGYYSTAISIAGDSLHAYDTVGKPW